MYYIDKAVGIDADNVLYWKRYAKINKKLKGVTLSVSFPAHGSFTMDDETRKNNRQKGLDSWLKCVLSNGPALLIPDVRDVVWEILEIDANRAILDAEEVKETKQPQRTADGKPLRKPSIR